MTPRLFIITAIVALLLSACDPGSDPAPPPVEDVPADVVLEVIPDTPEPRPDTQPDLPLPVICDPGEERCGDAGVEVCDAAGTSWELALACDPAELCLEDPFECCLPDCVGKKCGPDGCGGSCGGCPGSLECNDAGKCEEPCVPDCDDKDCGPDGCEGSCGTCDPGWECADGVCAELCVPDCSDEKTCGDDGCGASCGACEEGLECLDVAYGRHCSKPCVDLMDCPAERFCLGGFCNPWECLEDDDCGPALVCDPFLRCSPGTSCFGTDPCFPLDDPVTGGELEMVCDVDTATCVPVTEVCLDDQCYSREGVCVWVAPGEGYCDDGEPCTLDTCDPVAGCLHGKSDTFSCLDQVYTCEELHVMADEEAGVLTAATGGAACEVDADCHLCLFLDGFDQGCPEYFWFTTGADPGLLLAIDQAWDALSCDPDAACGPPPEPGPAPCCVEGACVFGGTCTAFVDSCLSFVTCGDLDTDGDGLGDGCDPDDDDDGALDGDDCQPLDALAFPGAEERCNFLDDDCDGEVDETYPELGLACVSEDPDACDPAGWWVCEESGAMVCQPLGWPGATEICDGKDNDCDGETDEPGSVGCVACWEDLDGDGFGADLPDCICAPDPQVCFDQAPGDCDDEDPDAHPGLPELCNDKDDNCNGVVDEFCD